MEEGRSSSSSSTNGNGLGEKKKKKVMVAIDESECSHYALDWALQNLVDTLANSDLCIFTVQPIADYSYLYASSFGAARMYSLSLSPSLLLIVLLFYCSYLLVVTHTTKDRSRSSQ